VEVVKRLGAIQAQDFEMAAWAIGLRLPGSNRESVETALERGEILRTHLLRPTWHLVSASDIRWLLELTGPRIRASLGSRHRQLEITDAVAAKSFRVMEKALSSARQLGRNGLIAALEAAGIATNDQRASHLFLLAELEGLICSGAGLGREASFALLDDRVPAGAALERDEALARLALRYFTSRGPASLADFAWWSGLKASDAKRGLGLVEKELESLQAEGQSYWLSHSASAQLCPPKTTRLLPAFDEYLIGYTDRRAAITDEDHAKAVSNNGIFRPTIVVDGQVVGIWARSSKKGEMVVEYDFFRKAGKTLMSAVEDEAGGYRAFCGRP
jgi:hypothetical protein